MFSLCLSFHFIIFAAVAPINNSNLSSFILSSIVILVMVANWEQEAAEAK